MRSGSTVRCPRGIGIVARNNRGRLLGVRLRTRLGGACYVRFRLGLSAVSTVELILSDPVGIFYAREPHDDSPKDVDCRGRQARTHGHQGYQEVAGYSFHVDRGVVEFGIYMRLEGLNLYN